MTNNAELVKTIMSIYAHNDYIPNQNVITTVIVGTYICSLT